MAAPIKDEAFWLARAAEFRALPDMYAERRRPDGTVERIEHVNLRSAELCERFAREARRARKKDTHG